MSTLDAEVIKRTRNHLELSHTGRDVQAGCGHVIRARHVPADPLARKVPGIVVTVPAVDVVHDDARGTIHVPAATLCGQCAAERYHIKIYDA